jgi:hypothetical protein
MTCSVGHPDVAIYLLEHGADPNIGNNVSSATCGLVVKVENNICEVK